MTFTSQDLVVKVLRQTQRVFTVRGSQSSEDTFFPALPWSRIFLLNKYS